MESSWAFHLTIVWAMPGLSSGSKDRRWLIAGVSAGVTAVVGLTLLIFPDVGTGRALPWVVSWMIRAIGGTCGFVSLAG